MLGNKDTQNKKLQPFKQTSKQENPLNLFFF